MEGYTFFGKTPTVVTGVTSLDIDTLKEEITALKKDNVLLHVMIDTLAKQAGIEFQEQPLIVVLPPYRGFK